MHWHTARPLSWCQLALSSTLLNRNDGSVWVQLSSVQWFGKNSHNILEYNETWKNWQSWLFWAWPCLHLNAQLLHCGNVIPLMDERTNICFVTVPSTNGQAAQKSIAAFNCFCYCDYFWVSIIIQACSQLPSVLQQSLACADASVREAGLSSEHQGNQHNMGKHMNQFQHTAQLPAKYYQVLTYESDLDCQWDKFL